MASPSLEVRQLTKCFGSFVTLNGVSLYVEPGVFVFQNHARHPHLLVADNIAAPLVHEPSAFLLDEPLASFLEYIDDRETDRHP